MAIKIKFPENFVWGAATDSYQIEGAWNKHGKGESIWDRFSHTPGNVLNNDTGDIANDHYHLWLKDIRLMKQIVLKAYRFSVAWPRSLPNGRGKANQKGLDFYSKLVDGLLAANITPFVALYHWDMPQALEEEGGWTSRYTAEAFADYADAISRAIGDRVKNWMTLNEPACSAWLGYDIGEHAPGVKDLPKAITASHHLLLAHGWAVPVLRRNSVDSEVGIALNCNWTVAASNSTLRQPQDCYLATARFNTGGHGPRCGGSAVSRGPGGRRARATGRLARAQWTGRSAAHGDRLRDAHRETAGRRPRFRGVPGRHGDRVRDQPHAGAAAQAGAADSRFRSPDGSLPASIEIQSSHGDAKQALAVLEPLDAAALEGGPAIHVQRANQYIRLGNGAKTLEEFGHALAQNPFMFGPLHDSGWLYYNDYAMDRAWSCWEAARAIAPGGWLHQPNGFPRAEA